MMLHRFPGDLPGLECPDRRRNQHEVGKRRMPADPVADRGGIVPAAVVQTAVLVLPGRSVTFGLGMTQQHQTAHDHNLDSVSV